MDDFPYLVMTKRASSSASLAEAETNYRMDVRMCMGSFNVINCLSWGSLPRKKCPVVWLLASEVPKQEAFE